MSLIQKISKALCEQNVKLCEKATDEELQKIIDSPFEENPFNPDFDHRKFVARIEQALRGKRA